MKLLVTGAAGFIGSHLCEELIARGHEVVGVDCFTDYYSPAVKEANLVGLRKSPRFSLCRENLLSLNWTQWMEGIEGIYHLAAQAGVRASWGDSFAVYTENNVLATQRLLEACKGRSLRKVVCASSSSVYGDCEEIPMTERSPVKPISPYGVTKLACEHLCRLYWKNYAVPTVALRYFTVYGPRQRPDMGFHKFISALLSGGTLHVYGDGKQTRDFTFVSDAVSGTLLAFEKGKEGEVYNIGGGSRVSVKQVLIFLEEMSGGSGRVVYEDTQKGDMKHTLADITKAHRAFGYEPRVTLAQGLEAEFTWLQKGGRC